MSVFGFGPDEVARIADAIRRIEHLALPGNNRQQRPARPLSGQGPDIVRVAAASPGIHGFYSGYAQIVSPSGDGTITMADGDPIWVLPANGISLYPGYYPFRRLGLDPAGRVITLAGDGPAFVKASSTTVDSQGRQAGNLYLWQESVALFQFPAPIWVREMNGQSLPLNIFYPGWYVGTSDRPTFLTKYDCCALSSSNYTPIDIPCGCTFPACMQGKVTLNNYYPCSGFNCLPVNTTFQFVNNAGGGDPNGWGYGINYPPSNSVAPCTGAPDACLNITAVEFGCQPAGLWCRLSLNYSSLFSPGYYIDGTVTVDNANCSPFSLTLAFAIGGSSVGGPGPTVDFKVQVQACTGGGGSGCQISSTGLGTVKDATGAATLTLKNVSVAANSLLLVNYGASTTGAQPGAGVTFGGTSLTLGDGSVLAQTSDLTHLLTVGLAYLWVANATTGDLVLTWTPAPDSGSAFSAVAVSGLSNPSAGVHSHAAGLGSTTPDSLSTAADTNACVYGQGALLLWSSGTLGGGAWLNGFTGGGQDVLLTAAGGQQLYLGEGYKIATAASAKFDAAQSQSNPVDFAAVVQAFP